MVAKNIQISIKGISPLLMNAFHPTPDGFEKMSPEEQAQYHEYRDPETDNLFIPGQNIQRCLIDAAIYSKGKGRSSLQRIVAACVSIYPDRCILGVKEYLIDSRPVVIQKRGRVLHHRPRLDEWEVSFVIDYDPILLSEDQIRKVVDDAGRLVGILDFRPACKGWFGKFMVTSWIS